MADKKIGIFEKIKNLFIDFKNEIKRIVWPTPKMAWKNTGIVFATILIVGVFVFLLDISLTELLSLIMSVSK